MNTTKFQALGQLFLPMIQFRESQLGEIDRVYASLSGIFKSRHTQPKVNFWGVKKVLDFY